MEKIEVGYSPIDATGRLAHHKFIFYTRADGTTFEIHGYGSKDYGSSPLDDMVSGLVKNEPAFGHLEVKVFKSSLERRKEALKLPMEVILEGKDLSREFFQMVGMAQGIAELETDYDKYSNNSNTLVDRIIQWSGGKPPRLDSRYVSPGSVADGEFKPEFFSRLPPVYWGAKTYEKHGDIVEELFGSQAGRGSSAAPQDSQPGAGGEGAGAVPDTPGAFVPEDGRVPADQVEPLKLEPENDYDNDNDNDTGDGAALHPTREPGPKEMPGAQEFSSFDRYSRLGDSPESEAAAISEFSALLAESFVDMNGDREAAEALAAHRFSETWDISAFAPVPKGTLLKHPVEAVYPASEEGGHGYVLRAAEAAVAARGVAAQRIYLAPNGKTGSDWRQGGRDDRGNGSRLTLSYEDANGSLRVLADDFQVRLPATSTRAG
jgi:hypothetical protein